MTPRKTRAASPVGFEFQENYDGRMETIARTARHSSVKTELVATPLGTYLLFRGTKANAALYFRGLRPVVDIFEAETGRTVGKGLKLVDLVTKWPRPYPDESPDDARRRWENDCGLVAATVSLLVV